MVLVDRVALLKSIDLPALVERAVKHQSLAVIDYYLREAEDHLASLEDAAATAEQMRQLLQAKVSEQQQKAASLDRAVEAYLRDENEAAAAASQNRLNSLEHLLDTYLLQLGAVERNAEILGQAMATLEQRHDSLKAWRAEAQALMDVAQRQKPPLDPGTSLAELAAEAEGELSERAAELASKLNGGREAPVRASAGEEARIEQVLDQRRARAQLAERRARWTNLA